MPVVQAEVVAEAPVPGEQMARGEADAVREREPVQLQRVERRRQLYP